MQSASNIPHKRKHKSNISSYNKPNKKSKYDQQQQQQVSQQQQEKKVQKQKQRLEIEKNQYEDVICTTRCISLPFSAIDELRYEFNAITPRVVKDGAILFCMKRICVIGPVQKGEDDYRWLLYFRHLSEYGKRDKIINPFFQAICDQIEECKLSDYPQFVNQLPENPTYNILFQRAKQFNLDRHPQVLQEQVQRREEEVKKAKLHAEELYHERMQKEMEVEKLTETIQHVHKSKEQMEQQCKELRIELENMSKFARSQHEQFLECFAHYNHLNSECIRLRKKHYELVQKRDKLRDIQTNRNLEMKKNAMRDLSLLQGVITDQSMLDNMEKGFLDLNGARPLVILDYHIIISHQKEVYHLAAVCDIVIPRVVMLELDSFKTQKDFVQARDFFRWVKQIGVARSQLQQLTEEERKEFPLFIQIYEHDENKYKYNEIRDKDRRNLVVDKIVLDCGRQLSDIVTKQQQQYNNNMVIVVTTHKRHYITLDATETRLRILTGNGLCHLASTGELDWNK